ncbi:MAG: RNA polymerase subunit sigma, partial [Planctomycetota bacterium]|nr:RNA polymerase subunit sigma [Planctomycetota bacterium]
MASDSKQGAGRRDNESREGDYDLIRRAQAGEERAFELLVRRFERRAFRVARNMLPTDEDAQDIA